MFKNILVVIFICLSVYLFFAGYDFQQFINDISKDPKKYDYYKGLSVLFTTGISLINFLVVITFFFSERVFKIKQLNYERKAFWFRKTIIEKRIDDINTAFKKVEDEEFNEVLKNEDLFSKKIREHCKKSAEILIDINNITRVFNRNLFEELSQIRRDFEDGFMKKAESIFQKRIKKKEMDQFINMQKEKYLETLYKFEVNNYYHKTKKVPKG
ncbi:hypothetical protein [Paenibacillus sp. MMO-58]|uniref:hypothetical protein n=1 Tax=Paenibacillus sp. MMO-58 TaxID=3081290 RepID=UPI00301ADC5F